MTVSIYGVRHLGPGSAANLLAAFAATPPDLILVEGPSDATDQLHWVANAALVPPVAILAYDPTQQYKPRSYPFAEFSPEWVAFRYAAQHGIPAQLFDLPQKHRIGRDHAPRMPDQNVLEKLANIAGFHHYTNWWNSAFEQRQPDPNHFAAVAEIMQLTRDAERELETPQDEAALQSQRYADQREAWMRTAIRNGLAAGHKQIAVVCGAWHGPALQDLDNAAADAALLTDMPTYAVAFSWVPWTYNRLTYKAGYKAGVIAPYWYHHLWRCAQDGVSLSDQTINWMTKTSQLLRKHNVDATPAHSIEAIRLAEALAVMRDLSFPGLPEMEEAAVTVMCNGQREVFKQLYQPLMVGNHMGSIPAEMPLTPLQHDLWAEQQRLRLRPENTISKLALDLRKPLHLDRSRLLHRLNLLGIPWGTPVRTGNRFGTYKEVWQLTWQPSFIIKLIENNMWGSTIYLAASNYATDIAEKAGSLTALTDLLDRLIQADLPDAMTHLTQQLAATVALSNNIPQMVAAIPPLLSALRYGSIRNTERTLLQNVVDQLLKHSLVGLPVIAKHVDDAAAGELAQTINTLNTAINTLDDARHNSDWETALHKMHQTKSLHGLLAGRVCRLLFDGEMIPREDALTALQAALSGLDVPSILNAAFWLEGFLQGSGLLLVHDDQLWVLIDDWINSLGNAKFNDVVPLLRRTFSKFSDATKQRLRDRSRNQQAVLNTAQPAQQQPLDVLPTVAKYLGVTLP